MLMFNVVYEDKIFEFPISPKSNIMELKMNLMGTLDLDYDNFNFFLENIGQLDMEEMMELPLELLELDIKKNHSIFILNKKNPNNFWKNCCASKIFPQKDGVTYAGYKMPQGFHICYPCWVYCHKGKKAEDDEDYEEPDSPVEAVSDECGCANNLNVKCRFDSCPNYSLDLSIFQPNALSAKSFIEDEKLNFEQRKEERANDRIRKREFDFERSIKFGMVRVRMYEEKHVQEKVLSILPLAELEEEAKQNCRKENTNDTNNKNNQNSNLNQTSQNTKIELESNQNTNSDSELTTNTNTTTKPLLSYRDELVRSMLKWFKYSFFTWCNQPLCGSCNQPASQYLETQTPTEAEALWAASRTELYKCLQCSTVNRFPRFNNPIKLCETKTGRCGEWANLFGAILRALNYEVRFVDNFEDHVWNEYFSEDLNSWIHVDPCENAWNTPLLYEQGWGRVMTFILGHSINGIQDVTARYIKDFALVAKRRNPNTEKKLKNILRMQNEINRKDFGKEEVMRLCYRDDYEIVMFGMEKFLSVEELLERQSGSEEWRKSRGEMK